jgi:hypothetical protein
MTRWTTSLRAGLATVTAVVALVTNATTATTAAIATTAPPTADAGYEAHGSPSAEDAVTAYMTALAAGDLDAMVGTFAVETFVDRFDLRAYLEFIGVYSAAAIPVLLPAETPLATALDVEQRHADVVNQIRRQFVTLADPTIDPSELIVLTDDATLDEFYANLVATVVGVDTEGAGSFAFVALGDVDPESAELYESENNQANIEARRVVLGADAITDLAVRFDLGGRGFLAFFSIVRYADGWWVEQLGGNFATLLGVDPLSAGTSATDGSG